MSGKRGFASMERDKRRAIASKGGKAAHASGKAHQFTTEEAREAGRRGGLARAGNAAARAMWAERELEERVSQEVAADAG